MKNTFYEFQVLNERVIDCRLCPRLVHFRETVPPRKSYSGQPYWRRPVPGFGDLEAWLLIIGLAPAIHGGNRTGRIFTGDESARFLMKNLYLEGFANQPESVSIEDGLRLMGCYMTPAVKCVPPKHRPTTQECLNCSRYLKEEFYLLKKVQAVLFLGKFAMDAYVKVAKQQNLHLPPLKFVHGAKYDIENHLTLYMSYHPSPQNTYTGTLTDVMFRNLLQTIKKDHCRS